MAIRKRSAGRIKGTEVGDVSILSKLFNIGPGKRFFFFNSLLTCTLPGAQQAISYGNAAFNIQEQTNLMNGQWNEEMSKLLTTLKGFQQHEEGNEIKLFKEVIKPLLELNPDKYNDFMDVIEGDTINYPKFLALLNILDTDIETASYLIKDMYSTTKAFNEKVETIITTDENININSQYEDFIGRRNDIITEIRAQLGAEGIESYSLISKNMAAVAEDLDSLNKNKNINVNDLDSLIIQLLNSNQSSIKISNTKTKLAQTNEIRLQMLQRIRQYAAAYQLSINDMIKKMLNTANEIQQFNQQSETNPREQEIINNLKKDLELALTQYDIIENQYKDLMSAIYGKNYLTTRKGKNKDQISGLTKERRQRIIAAFKKEGKNVEELEKFEEEKNDIRLKTAFNNYKKMIERILGVQTITINNLIKELDDRLKTSDSQLRKQTMTIVSETGGTLGLQQIKNQVSSIIGKKNIKADGLTFALGKAIIDDPKINLSAINKLEKSKINMAPKTLTKEIRSYNTKRKKNTLSYTSKGDLQASDKLDMDFLHQAEKTIKDQKKLSFILQNIFEIERSIKFADTFTELERGFHGGSLGAGLEESINNINDMMMLGGLQPQDPEFLMSAIMNAGPGMLGNKQKGALEMYLSAITAACMFTSGGQALRDWADSAANQLQGYSSNKIHLFVFNTVYVPLSYILKLVEEGMEKSINILATQTSYLNRGAQVVIYNPVNEEDDKVTTEFVFSDGHKSARLGDWQKTAEAGIPKIKLSMGLLAGFLDTLDSIQKVLSDIGK